MTKWMDYFAYLDELHAGSTINMFAAPGRLVSLYAITNVEAMEVCFAWMKTFDPAKPLATRVALAEAARPVKAS